MSNSGLPTSQTMMTMINSITIHNLLTSGIGQSSLPVIFRIISNKSPSMVFRTVQYLSFK